jgi:hypothetical protein
MSSTEVRQRLQRGTIGLCQGTSDVEKAGTGGTKASKRQLLGEMSDLYIMYIGVYTGCTYVYIYVCMYVLYIYIYVEFTYCKIAPLTKPEIIQPNFDFFPRA